jgi:hypothetical protein
LLRERLVAGDTDEEAVAFLVDRYGEYVLLNPPATGANVLLWIAGPAMLLAGAGIAFATFRRRAGRPQDALNADEKRAGRRDFERVTRRRGFCFALSAAVRLRPTGRRDMGYETITVTEAGGVATSP